MCRIIFQKIVSEQKISLPFQRNQAWKAIMREGKKVNKSLQHIPTENITKLNKLIYRGAKLINDKISISVSYVRKNKTWIEWG